MNSQLKRIDEIFLKDIVTNKDVVEYIDHILEMGFGNNEQLKTLRSKLWENCEISNTDKQYLLEILKNVLQLFRTYGKKSDGLTKYIKTLKS